MGEEADYLWDRDIVSSVWDDFADRLDKTSKTNMISRRDTNKSSKVGSTIRCPVCGTSFVKTTYNKIFCSSPSGKKNNRGTYTKFGHSSCKDTYWNIVENKTKPF